MCWSVREANAASAHGKLVSQRSQTGGDMMGAENGAAEDCLRQPGNAGVHS